MATTEIEAFPDTLSGFDYGFKDGKMQNLKTGDPFAFVIREGDHSYNQKRYEAIGELVTEEVYKLLESECSLKRHPVPVDADQEDPQTFVFMSDDALDNPDKLLVLIHGSGVVRAGQWARRLIINDCLDSGTQIPFIKKAQEEGYGVLVMNTNDNTRVINGKTLPIEGSSRPEDHAIYVWKKYVRGSKAQHIALVVHSFGGCVTTALFQSQQDDFEKRVFAVAMTDSVHFINRPKEFKNLIKKSRNWVSSLKPLDTVLSSFEGDIRRVSAGVNVHEQTSWSSFHSVFKFLKERYDSTTTVVDLTAEDSDEGENDETTLDRSMSFQESTTDEEEHKDNAVVGTKNVHELSDSDDEQENGCQDVEMEDTSEEQKRKKEKLGD